MYVVFELNGVQYDGRIGEQVTVDLLNSDDKTIKIQNVLLAKESNDSVFIGKPYIESAEINANYIKDIKDKKVIVFKFKAKKGYRNKNGHRQGYSIIQLESANIGGKTITAQNNVSAQQ